MNGFNVKLCSELSWEEVNAIMDIFKGYSSFELDSAKTELAELEKKKFEEVNFITPVIIVMRDVIALHKVSFKLWGVDHIVDSFREHMDCVETDTCLYVCMPNNDVMVDLLYRLPEWVGSTIQIL